ncbi:subtilisin-like protease SBT2.5 [Wolffia australiana]
MSYREGLLLAVSALCLLIIANSEIYIVSIEGDPVVSYSGGVEGFPPTAIDLVEEFDVTSEHVVSYSLHLQKQHDSLLDSLFEGGTYQKLYSYMHLINGFSVHLSPEQAEVLSAAPGVKHVERDMKVRKMTTHTPEFLGLPTGVWPNDGGFDKAGEDIVIGFIDSGIYPHHPSFAVGDSEPYSPLPRYRGKCEVDPSTKKSFCNGKVVGAQHFAAAAIAAGAFNPDIDFPSPMDGDGHGSHTAAIAAGKNGVPVWVRGHEFGKASGMAPRARIAVYKALYRLFGGFVSDVVAAIDQAVRDGVDVINLSVGPNSPPSTTRTTFLNPFDATLLSAVKAGVFVAQAAGNGGPFPKTVISFSPWIMSVAAAIDDRRYKNHLFLGNGKAIPGIGLSPSTPFNGSFSIVAANDALLGRNGPADCQRPELLDKNLIRGRILMCGYSFNFVSGSASMKKVAETASVLGAAGFVLVVEKDSPGVKYEPIPLATPGILIIDVRKSKELIDYYDVSTRRDWARRAIKFEGTAAIGEGMSPTFHRSAPMVAAFSSRGPDVKDFTFQDADVLKPDILAPGSLIWAAWSPNGTDEANYVGEEFAMVSGTSMAAPHIAGIAALIKQRHPRWSPAAIKSALMTTAITVDRNERPILAQRFSDLEELTLTPATPFDLGSGAVSPQAALDPGLVFDAGYEDYVRFLCSVPGVDPREIRSLTGAGCAAGAGDPASLNAPSIAVARLEGSRTVRRAATNVAGEEETYVISTRMSPEVALEVEPTALTFLPGATREIHVTLIARSVKGGYSFGEILMKGSRGRRVRIPVVAMALS